MVSVALALLILATPCVGGSAFPRPAPYDFGPRAALYNAGDRAGFARAFPDLREDGAGLAGVMNRPGSTTVDLADARFYMTRVAELPLPLATTARRERLLDVIARTLSGVALRSGVAPHGTRVPDLAVELGIISPDKGLTMIGLHGLQQLRHAMETVLAEDVPGDLLEAGVWAGGASIFALALLDDADAAFHPVKAARGRRVWLADSFQGLPPGDPAQPAGVAGAEIVGGAGGKSCVSPFGCEARFAEIPRQDFVEVSAENVKENIRAFGYGHLLGDDDDPSSMPGAAVFLQGFFNDTMAFMRGDAVAATGGAISTHPPPPLPDPTFAVIRLDGDMFTSYMDVLFAAYDRLSLGGFVICDDCTLVSAISAVVTFRGMHGIDTHQDEQLVTLGIRAHWRKVRHVHIRYDLWPGTPGKPKGADLPFFFGQQDSPA